MQTGTEHRALAEALHGCIATVVLSGYASEIGERLRAEVRLHGG